MLSYLIVDIETVPLEILDENIWIYLSEKATTRTMHPVFSKIIVIGLKQPRLDPIMLSGNTEKEILNEFWKKVGEIKPIKFITYNGYKFDIPFILVRSAINNITPTIEINTNKWYMEDSNHYDCMLALSYKENFLNVALDIVCKMFSINVVDKISGNEIEAYYKRNDWDPIIHRCLQDVILTEKLYKKICGIP